MEKQSAYSRLPMWLGIVVYFFVWRTAASAQNFSVNLLTPTNNQFYAALPAVVTIEAAVSNAPGGVARVELYARNSLVATVTNPPYAAVWTNVVPGTNILRAIAYAVGGGMAISPDVRTVVNQTPTAVIASPTNGAWVGLGSDLVITVAASDPEGALSVVHFYINGGLVRSVETPPYQVTVSNLIMGEHQLVAVAEDAWGLRGTSAPVRVEVIVPDVGIVETFEGGVAPGAWSEFAGALGMAVLVTNYGGAVSGTNSLWFGGDDDRYAATRPLTLRNGATVEFWLRIAGAEEANWHLAELPDEGVVLEYSNAGGEWKPVAAYNTPAFTNWQRVSVAVPAAALVTNTMLRWRQPLHSGEGFSHWALDDVRVLTGPTPPVILQAPQAQVVVEGETATFSAICRGSEPMVYQWRMNGTNMPGATNATLTISNVTTAMSAWNIVVLVSNAFGSVSAPALLTVQYRELRISVYDHPAIVDTTSGGIMAESDNVQASLRTLTNVVVGTFTNLLTAGATNEILWFPEFENGDLTQYMTAAERQALNSFVTNGGLLVIHGSYALPTRCQSFLNQVFDFAVVASQVDTVPYARTAAADNTAFVAATNWLQSYSGCDVLKTTTLPVGSLSIYEALGQTLVAILPAGRGKVIFLGWDWYDAQPLGGVDGGWLQVMRCAVVERMPSGLAALGFVAQPVNQKALSGGTASFSVSVYGTLPLAFRWQFAGTNLPGATNATLTLSNVTAAQAGNYRVVVTNQYGSATSSNALLEVIEFNPTPFQILSLGTNNSKVVEHDSLTGDDRNSIAISGTRVFYSGDSSTAHFRLEDLSDGTRIGRILDGMVSDLRTERMYCLGNGATPIGSSGGTITTLLEMNGDTGAFTGNQIALSTPITASSGSGIFAGYGQIVIHNYSRVYSILLPSGMVADLGAMSIPTHVRSDGWAYWGVAEYFGGQFYLTYVQNNQTIVRARVPDGAVTTLATFGNLSDMACFTVVPSLNRWYFHYEGGSQFGGLYETIGYADATFNYTPAPIPPSIYAQPVERVTVTGGSVQFTALVYGARTLSYQWRREGADLPGATNATLQLTNLILAQTGVYQLMVSNAYGAATSAVATLTVVDIGAGMFDDFEPGIDFSQWAAFSGVAGSSVLATNYGGSVSPGNALWINNNSLRFAVTRALNTTAGGFISFYLRLGSGSDRIWELVDLPAKGVVLEYATNGTNWVEIGRYDTTNYYAWTHVVANIPMAAQGLAVQFRWRQLNNSGSIYDHWALDDVMIATGPTVPEIARQPQNVAGVPGGTVLLTVAVNGSGPLRYQWQQNGEDLPGATNLALVLTNLATGHAGNYRLIASNALGAVTSAVALVATVDAGNGLYESFEPDINLAQWSSFGGTVGIDLLATNYGGSVSLSNSLWFSYYNTRFATTRALNTTAGGVIGFYLRLGVGASPWETVDLPAKGVVLEYSTNGTIWTEMGRYATADFYTWTQVATNIPTAARSPKTLFRWRQLTHSGSAYDHWALDEVWIALQPTPPVIFAPPQSQVAVIGGMAQLSVEAVGNQPLVCQWQLDDQDLPGATNTTLWLEHLATNQAGAYRAVLTNPYGSVTSAVVNLAVVEAGAGFFDNFERGIDLARWSSFGGMVGSTVLATNYGGYMSPSNSIYFNNSGLRFAATRPLNTLVGGDISFFLRLGSSNSTTWELVNLPSYGIVLEYSTNRTSWIEMGRYNTTNFYAWTQISTNIPVAARAAAVQFRWRQLSNSGGTGTDHWTLDDVLIAIGPTPPSLYEQLRNRSGIVGGKAVFAAAANGSPPLTYQWRFNGEDLPGATRPIMPLNNLTAYQAGAYQVVVSNLYGIVTSAVATLTVWDVGTGMYDAFDPDIDLAQWTSFGGVVGNTVLATNYGGFVSPSNSLYFSTFSARFAETRSINTLAGGIISFQLQLANGEYLATPPWETVDLPNKGIVLDYSTNGMNWTEMGRYNTTNFYAWTQVATNIPAAAQGAGVMFRWRQLSNSGGAFDHWALDDVIIATGPTPPTILGQPTDLAVVEGFNATFAVGAGGSAPLVFQWCRDGADLPGATNATLVITNAKATDMGSYSVVVTNQYGSLTSSVVSLSLLPGGFAGYFTDGNIGSTGPAGPVLLAGLTPVQITNITTFNLNSITCLFLDQSSGITTTLQNRLPDIQAWVSAGGLLIVHDRYVATSTLLGTTGVVANMYSGKDIDVFPPGDTLVTQGPFGVIGNSTLDGGGNYSTHGYLTHSTLPPGARPILSWAANTNQVVAFSYPLGSGFIYYSAIPLDYYLDGNGSNPFRFNATKIYAPNVLIYMQSLSTIAQPPRIITPLAGAMVQSGGSTNLGVQAVGTPPLSYQWLHYGSPLAGATNQTLTFTNMSHELNGFYSVVVSNAFGIATSSLAAVVVDQGTVSTRVPVFDITKIWRYNQSGSDLGTTWRDTSFSDSSWSSGPGLLAVENNSAITPYIRTTLSLSNGSAQVTTYYFRSWVNVPAYPANLGVTLVSSNLVDDGAVYYFNGVEQGRFLMPTGTITSTTYATIDSPENVYQVIRFTNSAPTLGTSNLLAVEVHQNSAGSSDIVFGMALYADVVYPRDPPQVNSTVTNIVVNQGQSFTLAASANSVIPLSYRWFLNSQQLGNTQPTISVPGAQPYQTGEYRVVVSNVAGVVTALVARVTVVSPPSITQGPASQTLELGMPLQLQVVGVGGALNYQWRQGGVPLTGMTNAQLVISNTTPAHTGVYDVVVANSMGVVTSVVAQVSFQGAWLPVPSLVLTNRALQLRFSSPTGVVYQVEASEDLRQWTPLGAVTNATGTVDFLDDSASGRWFRFYRLRAGP